MLILVLLCVLVAFGLLVSALVTGTAAWAWGSVAASVVAAGLLVADFLRRRSAERPNPRRRLPEPAAALEEQPAAEPSGSTEVPSGAQPIDHHWSDDSSPSVTMLPGDEEEPGQEDVDDALRAGLADLPDEVLVVDERPRYHLSDCSFLRGRPTITLPVSEAVELGFTGCARCRPSHALGERRGVGTAG